jgi:hypothetical protein
MCRSWLQATASNSGSSAAICRRRIHRWHWVVHAYLPHSVEGFFLNGGKRAYITRVLSDVATRATRNLFFEDPDLVNPGDTILLRAAQQDTGTNVNPPLLYVLDPANFALNDWVRIGDGSRAEYRQSRASAPMSARVAQLSAAQRARRRECGARTIRLPRSPRWLTPRSRSLNPVEAGALEITIENGDDAGLVALLPPGTGPAGWQLVQVGVAAAAEYAFATLATDLGGGQVRLTLAHPLRFPYAAAADATVVEIAGGTNDTLSLQANTGDLLHSSPRRHPGGVCQCCQHHDFRAGDRGAGSARHRRALIAVIPDADTHGVTAGTFIPSRDRRG